MDPFEVRMQFLSQLRKLNASQTSISKVVGYAIKYFSRCGEDLWECIIEEVQNGSLNMRINIFYFLDGLCETCLQLQANTQAVSASRGSRKPTSYIPYVSRDLQKVVELVVPDNRDGLINLASTRQILDSWRSKRVIETEVLNPVVEVLDKREEHLRALAPSSTSKTDVNRDEIMRRFEEDRERHKVLRQKRWYLPAVTAIPPATQQHVSRLASTHPSSFPATSPNTSPTSPNVHQTYHQGTTPNLIPTSQANQYQQQMMRK
ncbi:hypothetical protein FRC03_008202 [Tulasnella sp. 419]|nr:hypothetical protein FRC03_008202 [Tulasnella sp. 419]